MPTLQLAVAIVDKMLVPINYHFTFIFTYAEHITGNNLFVLPYIPLMHASPLKAVILDQLIPFLVIGAVDT